MFERGAARREEGGRVRRWFVDADFDLQVFLEPDGSMYGFRLRYEAGDAAWLLTWTPIEQYLSYRIEPDGAGREALLPMDPGGVDGQGLLKRLKPAAAFIDPHSRSFVLELVYSLDDEVRRCRYCARRNRSEWRCPRCWLRACPDCMERKGLRKARCTRTEASHEWVGELAALRR